MTSYFYLQASKTVANADFIDQLESYADSKKNLIYVLDRPLTDQKYSYSYNQSLIILSPKHKIGIIDFGKNQDKFENYVEDVIEDVGSIADKYLYKGVIGRPRYWRRTLVETELKLAEIDNVGSYFDSISIYDANEIKKIDLLISLFIGSINNIERVKNDVPVTTLDKVKQKIQLFDGDQTRFVYQNPDKKIIKIQGLSGTGKTELLLHKLKDLYTADPECSIFFTCWNKILGESLRARIPAFFNFMKVEQQIEWNKRLWCRSAWGSNSYVHSGAYRYLCAFYQIPFYHYSYQMKFDRACRMAIDDIKTKYRDGKIEYAFTYMFVDESQDFDESFFELCELVTEKNIYIAGDIFQSIFDENFSGIIEPDFLLGKCYRTDPKTLMFAHALGMGLFEKIKLRWLEEKEWKDCGYNVKIEDSKYFLGREPLRRFEDLDDDFESIRIVEGQEKFSNKIVEIIEEVIKENPTVKADDIGIVLLDQDNSIYELADVLEGEIQKKLKWSVNKAYESKVKVDGEILISNRNNVKGLEFPFVICVTKRIKKGLSYRNSIYTMLTRSFIKSFLLVQSKSVSGITEEMELGLKRIIENNEMIIQEPSDEEKEKIRTRFKYSLKKMSHYDLMMEIFKKLKVEKRFHDKLLQTTQQMDMIESDEETLTDFIKDNFKYLKER
ncbi:MAG: DEAD/DEAH box helicase [Ginsengibacter sp.]